MRVQLDDSMSEESSETAGKDLNQTHQEMVVLDKLEKGDENVFSIVRSKKMNLQPLSKKSLCLRNPNVLIALEPAPRKVVHTGNLAHSEERTSPLKKYINHEDEICPSLQQQVDKNQFDIQGYYKRINDMMMKQEDFGDFNNNAGALKPTDMNKKNNASYPTSFENGNNMKVLLYLTSNTHPYLDQD